ncbi:hypothetical protein GCM10022221_25480 [Actinocorallia aurea]
MRDLVHGAGRAGGAGRDRWAAPYVDLTSVGWTIMWPVSAYVNDRFFRHANRRAPAYRLDAARFRAQLHRIIDRLV